MRLHLAGDGVDHGLQFLLGLARLLHSQQRPGLAVTLLQLAVNIAQVTHHLQSISSDK